MVHYPLIAHHLVWQELRLCDGRLAGPGDILTADLQVAREARGMATLCPACQEGLGRRRLELGRRREVFGRQSLACLYSFPVQDGYDDVRNCGHCRAGPHGAGCAAWERVRAGVMTLREESVLIVPDTGELGGLTGGVRAAVFRFFDGSVGYFAQDAPDWREAGEVTGVVGLERAERVLSAVGRPGGRRPLGGGAARRGKSSWG